MYKVENRSYRCSPRRIQGKDLSFRRKSAKNLTQSRMWEIHQIRVSIKAFLFGSVFYCMGKSTEIVSSPIYSISQLSQVKFLFPLDWWFFLDFAYNTFSHFSGIQITEIMFPHSIDEILITFQEWSCKIMLKIIHLLFGDLLFRKRLYTGNHTTKSLGWFRFLKWDIPRKKL